MKMRRRYTEQKPIKSRGLLGDCSNQRDAINPDVLFVLRGLIPKSPLTGSRGSFRAVKKVLNSECNHFGRTIWCCKRSAMALF
jgi:hypothetical protein